MLMVEILLMLGVGLALIACLWMYHYAITTFIDSLKHRKAPKIEEKRVRRGGMWL